jgi:hypothetical protein
MNGQITKIAGGIGSVQKSMLGFGKLQVHLEDEDSALGLCFLFIYFSF